jgi:translation initiation factor eIF-2B subunit epsilon
MAIDPDTKQLLYYEDKADYSKGTLHLENSLLADNPSLSLHHDKQVDPPFLRSFCFAFWLTSC